MASVFNEVGSSHNPSSESESWPAAVVAVGDGLDALATRETTGSVKTMRLSLKQVTNKSNEASTTWEQMVGG